MSSSNHNNLAHLKIPLQDILSATNNFSDQNIVGKDAYEKFYKGQLLWSGQSIHILAGRLSKEWLDGDQQLWMEVSILSNLKHKYLVSFVGFCDDNDEKVIIYKDETRRSLYNRLSDPIFLTWVRRLEISVGVAQALSYIHYDESRDFSVIHRDINSGSIYLNDDWEPKLGDFIRSMKIKASERHNSFNTDKVWSTDGYTDPVYIETKSAHHKSDMYSFGIVLFELLCGRTSVIEDQDNKYLAPVAIFYFKEKLLHDLIDPDLLKQMDPQSFNVFVETAYDCLNEDRSQRPNIDDIVTRLEKALELQLERENVEQSVAAAEVEGTSFNHKKGSVTFASIGNESQVSKNTKSFLKDPSLLRLSFEDLESAIKKFYDENVMNEDEITIFKGRLLHSEQFIDIFGKIYQSYSEKDESKKFSVELSMLSSLKHKNLVSLIGFYEGRKEKAIIYKREAKGSLEKYLSDQTPTWIQRLRICVGVANALSYIHYDDGRDFSVIHCNIRSSKILLDDEWEPKLSGFQLALKNTVARRHRLLLTCDIIENVYLDPKYKKIGGMTHKSDVYSFGVVLFEVLCGRRVVIPYKELGEGLLGQLKKSHLEEMINPHLRKQMDPEAFKIFSETAYYCIQEERGKRPHIDQVVKGLEKALDYQWRHENPVDRTSFNRLKNC